MRMCFLVHIMYVGQKGIAEVLLRLHTNKQNMHWISFEFLQLKAKSHEKTTLG